MTVRDIVSMVRSTHKLLNSDNMINDRTVARESKNFSITLITQKTNIRRYWNTDTIFTTVPCIEMIEVPLSSCCAYSSPRTISRSKEKIPRISDGNYAYLIKGVFNAETSIKIDYMDILRYINYLKLNTGVNKVYYFIKDDYLYVTSDQVRLVALSAYFEDDVPDSLTEDCNCEPPRKNKCPQNPLDLPFKCPGSLVSTVVKMVSDQLLRTYFQINDDKTSDEKDDQVSKV